MNYSRWMSKDPDAEPEVIEDEPRRFSLPRPAGSVVASGALVAVVALGGAAFVRSIATPDASVDSTQTDESPTAEQSDGPGPASVDDSTSNDLTDDHSTSGDPTSDSSVSDGPTIYHSVPAGPQPRHLQELRQSDHVPLGGPSGDGRPRGHLEPALPPPMLAP